MPGLGIPSDRAIWFGAMATQAEPENPTKPTDSRWGRALKRVDPVLTWAFRLLDVLDWLLR